MSDAETTDRLRKLEVENARLRRMLDQRGMSGVLRHQVRNALGLMRAILRRSAESKSSVEDFAAHLEGRFDALLRIQAILIANPDEEADLYSLVLGELLSHAFDRGDKLVIDGPSVRLKPRCAEMLGLAMHELATNAIKFGALTTEAGRIEISWALDREPPPRLALTWDESGLKGVETEPSLKGFGTQAINGMLPHQLGAETRMRFRSDGLQCRIALPLVPELVRPLSVTGH